MTKLYVAIARALVALENCRKGDAELEWEQRWQDRLKYMCDNYLPHGSGVDCGVHLNMDASTTERLVFIVPFHNMDSYGSYVSWDDYTVVVRPSLARGFALHATMAGKNRTYADTAYIGSLMREALEMEYELSSSFYGEEEETYVD